jgi:hypothetical protein
MRVAKASPPAATARPVTDGISVLGFAVGCAMIIFGLLLLGLSLTN